MKNISDLDSHVCPVCQETYCSITLEITVECDLTFNEGIPLFDGDNVYSRNIGTYDTAIYTNEYDSVIIRCSTKECPVSGGMTYNQILEHLGYREPVTPLNAAEKANDEGLSFEERLRASLIADGYEGL